MLPEKTLKHINKLQQKKYRREFEEFLVEGVKGVEEALASDYEVIVVIVEGNRRDEEDLARIVASAEKRMIDVLFTDRKDSDKLKTTETFPGVLAVVAMPEEGDIEGNSIVCLDGVKDPGNLGTIIRTADWFGVTTVLLSEECVDPYNDKVVRSTMGSLFHVQIVQSSNLVKDLEELKKKGYTALALAMEGESVAQLKPQEKSVYIFGSESHGVRDEVLSLCDKTYTIPGKGKAESLNVAVAAGIILSNI